MIPAVGTTLAVKLGSLLVHAEEATEDGAHAFDLHAMRALISDPEVQAWREEMDKLALLPVKRA
jgi:hypothetical protein